MPDDPRETGFAAFVADEGPRLLREAYLLTGDDEDADALLRTALARLYRGWDGPLETSLADERARVQLVRSFLHRGHRARPDPGLVALSTHQVRPDDVDTGWLLLSLLDPRARAAVVLRGLGMGDTRAAAALGCSTTTLRRHRARALRQLRDQTGGTDVDHLVRAAVDDRAQLSQHPDPDLAAQTVSRVRIAARGRRIAIAVLATLIGLAVIALGTGRAGRSVTPDPSPTLPSAVPSAVPSGLDPSSSSSPVDPFDIVNRLPVGAPIGATPRIDVTSDGTFFNGLGFQLRLAGAPMEHRRAGDGWLVQTHGPDWAGENGDAGATITYADNHSHPRVVARTESAFAVSPDGTSFAHIEVGDVPPWRAEFRPTIVVRDVRTGKETARRTLDQRLPLASVEEWTADGIIVVCPSPATTLVLDGRLRDRLSFPRAITLATEPNSKGYLVILVPGAREPVCALVVRRLEATPNATVGCGEVITVVDDGADGWLVRMVSQGGHVQLARVQSPDGWSYLPVPDLVERLPLVEEGCLHEGALLVCPVHPVRYYNDKLQPAWVRWDPETGHLERAPLPAGVDGVLS